MTVHELSEDHHGHRPRYLWWVVGIILIVLLIVAVWGIISRLDNEKKLAEQTNAEAVPSVTVADAKTGPDQEDLVLPGNVQALIDTPVYARTSGYIKQWYTDIGTPVKAGQLLADIETPEVDDQLRQARADLKTAIANNDLAQITAKRWLALLKTDSVSRQETDEKVGDAEAKAAQVASSQANVARLTELENYKHVIAPYNGVVTARETDVGNLINAGSGQGPELFRIADKTKLRIYIQVPQTYAQVTTPGQEVQMSFAEHPGQKFVAKVVRTSESLDPSARTLLVELQADNANGTLLPGGFTEVHLTTPAMNQTVRIPASALLFRAEGLRVATYEQDGHAKLHQVKPGRDFGTELEILDGIKAGEKVITDPPDSIEDGDQVALAPPKQKNQGGGQQGQSKDSQGKDGEGSKQPS